jgi:heme oxygenase
MGAAMRDLRAATAERHARLERRLDIAARLESPAAYGAWLERLYGFYRPLEARLSADVSTRERALGVLYVLEGATLGGAVIARIVRRRLGVTPAFFGAGGAAIGARWRAFGAAVDAFAGGAAPADMRLAATECFEHLESWLCPGMIAGRRVRKGVPHDFKPRDPHHRPPG